MNKIWRTIVNGPSKANGYFHTDFEVGNIAEIEVNYHKFVKFAAVHDILRLNIEVDHF
jgi:hypothetical protein